MLTCRVNTLREKKLTNGQMTNELFSHGFFEIESEVTKGGGSFEFTTFYDITADYMKMSHVIIFNKSKSWSRILKESLAKR